ncbi:hypothetical protein MKL26_07375 [Streptococcus suis]|nr:hypothetical protein [Streptococcus suis]
MAKKIRDVHGNVYVQKKPFYKRIWFIVLIELFAIGMINHLASLSDDQSYAEQVNRTLSQCKR